MTRLFSSFVLAIASAAVAFGQIAHAQPAPGNQRTGAVRTHQGSGPQVVPGGASPQGQNPPAPAGGVTTQPTTAPSYDPACDRFILREFIPEERAGQFAGQKPIPWMDPAQCDPSWSPAIHTDSACDPNRTFVETWTQNPGNALCYDVALTAQWKGADGKGVTVTLATKQVWHEDAGRGHAVGVVYSTLWVHEDSDREMKKQVKKLTIEWARIPFLLQQVLGVDEQSLGRVPAAGAVVVLDFGTYRKLTESPNGWYTVTPVLQEGKSSTQRTALQITSDFSKVSTAVANAERNRNRIRYSRW